MRGFQGRVNSHEVVNLEAHRKCMNVILRDITLQRRLASLDLQRQGCQRGRRMVAQQMSIVLLDHCNASTA